MPTKKYIDLQIKQNS